MPTYPIVGARFRPPAQDVLALLPQGADLILERQPDNPYDVNAIRVLLYWEGLYDDILAQFEGAHEDPLHLGFIPREIAAELAPEWDARHSPLAEASASRSSKLTFNLAGTPCAEIEE